MARNRGPSLKRIYALADPEMSTNRPQHLRHLLSHLWSKCYINWYGQFEEYFESFVNWVLSYLKNWWSCRPVNIDHFSEYRIWLSQRKRIYALVDREMSTNRRQHLRQLSSYFRWSKCYTNWYGEFEDCFLSCVRYVYIDYLSHWFWVQNLILSKSERIYALVGKCHQTGLNILNI